jgi:hypothetical protein
MSASEKPKDETEREPEEGTAGRPAGNIQIGEQPEPLFLRGRSDGRKGNAQDEKDETGE